MAVLCIINVRLMYSNYCGGLPLYMQWSLYSVAGYKSTQTWRLCAYKLTVKLWSSFWSSNAYVVGYMLNAYICLIWLETCPFSLHYIVLEYTSYQLSSCSAALQKEYIIIHIEVGKSFKFLQQWENTTNKLTTFSYQVNLKSKIGANVHHIFKWMWD